MRRAVVQNVEAMLQFLHEGNGTGLWRHTGDFAGFLNLNKRMMSSKPIERVEDVFVAPIRYEREADVPYEGVVTVKDAIKFSKKWHSGGSIIDALDNKINFSKTVYVDLPSERVPEAQAEFYHHPELARTKVRQFNYGCKGATGEFELSGTSMCLDRPCIRELCSQVLGTEIGQRNHFMVDGWRGSGKSLALYSLAVAAREKGWVVMYVPSAALFVQGGKFKKKNEDQSVWYTPVAAQHILRALQLSHKQQLEEMPSRDGTKSLAAQCSDGLEARDAINIVETAIDVLHGVLDADGKNGFRTLVIVDEYNYLYHQTEYHETVHQFHRRRIKPEELALASAFQLLKSDRPSGTVVAASTHSGPISPKTMIPMIHGTHIVRVPRYSLDEVSTVGNMLASKNLLEEVPSDDIVRRVLALTNGNGKEIRQGCVSLFQGDSGHSLSSGYRRKK